LGFRVWGLGLGGTGVSQIAASNDSQKFSM